MKSLLFFLLLLPILVHGQNEIPVEVQKKILIGAMIQDNSLQDVKGICRDYYQKHIAPLTDDEDLGPVYSNVLKRQARDHEKYLSSPKIFGSFRPILTNQEILILMKIAQADNEDPEFVDFLKDTFQNNMDTISFVDDSIENTSGKNKNVIILPEKIEINEKTTLLITEGKEGKHHFSSKDRYFIDLLKNCFRQLMQDYRIPDYSIEVDINTKIQSKINHRISPLEMYMLLVSPTHKLNYFYFGDFAPSGKLRPWGYMKDHFSRLKGKTNLIAYIPEADFQNLQEIALLEGLKTVVENHFVGESKLDVVKQKEMHRRSDKSIQEYTLIISQVLRGQLKGAALLSELERVIALNPNHYSAQIYKALLTRKFSPRMSLMNSYFEFESNYNDFKGINFHSPKDKKQPEPPHKPFKEMIESIENLQKVVHPDMRVMNQSLLEATKILQEVKEKKYSSLIELKNLRKKYYDSVREINLRRDLLLDSQKAIDGIFVR